MDPRSLGRAGSFSDGWSLESLDRLGKTARAGIRTIVVPFASIRRLCQIQPVAV